MVVMPNSIAVAKTETVPLSKLKHYPGNPRRGNVAVIVESLKTNGQYKALVVQRSTNYVLVGNHTLIALKEMGAKEALIHWLDVDDATAKRIVLVDNRSQDLATYSDAALIELLQSLEGNYVGTGFDQQVLDDLLAGQDESEDVEKEGPEPGYPPAEPNARLGDIYALGEHRLLCGSATDEKAIKRLMNGERAQLLLTDPPYGVEYRDGSPVDEVHQHDAIANDTVGEIERLLEPAFTVAREVSDLGAAAYIFHADSNGSIFRQAFVDAGWDLKQVLVWVKQQLVLGRQDYQWKHEPILYGWVPGAAHRWFGGFSQTTVLDHDYDVGKMNKAELAETLTEILGAVPTTVIREDRPRKSPLHPTTKPVKLCARLMANSTARGDIVLDPFGGSGSTLIAAENLGRRARLVDLSPGYIDVIIDRWEAHTGQQAELVDR